MRDLDALLSVQPCSPEQSEWFAGIHSPRYPRSRGARRRFTSACISMIPPSPSDARRRLSYALPRAPFLARSSSRTDLLSTALTFAREEDRLPLVRSLGHNSPLRRATRARRAAAVDRAGRRG